MTKNFEEANKIATELRLEEEEIKELFNICNNNSEKILRTLQLMQKIAR